MIRLTKKRAKIITDHFYPLLQVNIEAGDGDIYNGGLGEYSDRDIQAALDWLWQEAYKRQQPTEQKGTRDDDKNV